MAGAHDTLLERTSRSPKSSSGRSASTVRSILFFVHADYALETRLKSALALARACSAHLRLLQVVPVEAYTVVDLFGGTLTSNEAVASFEEGAAAVRAQLERRLAAEEVEWTYEYVTASAVPALIRSAAFADVVILGREENKQEYDKSGPHLLGELVSRVRSPVCVPAAAPLDPFGTAVIAWNGSFEAASAVREAIGLIRLSSKVRIVRFDEDKEATFADERLVEYLDAHGLDSDVEVRSIRLDLSSDLIAYAAEQSASYLVMGAYSHSRAGEFLFGGVTHDLLRECPVTLVMGH